MSRRTSEERFALGAAHPLRATVMYPPTRELFRRYRVEGKDRTVEAALAGVGRRVGLYVHLPFCSSRCRYCDYATLPLATHGDRLDEYVEAIVAQLESVAAAAPDVEVTGLDLGGGTPAVLAPRHFERILETVRGRFRLATTFEVSTETTPALASDLQKWRAFAAAGLDRVSLGLQSADPAVLRAVGRGELGRIEALAGVESLRAAGIRIINVDLMFALPGQSQASWLDAVDFAISLGLEVVTTYDTVYKNRQIADDAARSGRLPGADHYGRLYDAGFDRLRAAGYRADYGSVNFSRVPGRLGTSRYLEGRILDGVDYVGVGLYASSLLGRTWVFAPADLEAWLESAHERRLAAGDAYALPIEHVMAKYLLLALSYGFIDPDRFARRFGEPLEDRFGDALALLEARGLLARDGGDWRMTPGSFGELPGMRAAFYPEEALDALSLPVPGRLGADELAA